MKHILQCLLLTFVVAACGKKSGTAGNAAQAESAQHREATVVGAWHTTITPRNGASFDAYLQLNPNGTAVMGSENAPTKKRLDDIKWSMNGNAIYLYKQGETSVAVFEILSLDAHSLVIHAKGEPEDEIVYFTRK